MVTKDYYTESVVVKQNLVIDTMVQQLYNKSSSNFLDRMTVV